MIIVENKSKNTYICIPIHEKAPERVCNFQVEKQANYKKPATKKRVICC